MPDALIKENFLEKEVVAWVFAASIFFEVGLVPLRLAAELPLFEVVL